MPNLYPTPMPGHARDLRREGAACATSGTLILTLTLTLTLTLAPAPLQRKRALKGAKDEQHLRVLRESNPLGQAERACSQAELTCSLRACSQAELTCSSLRS